MSLVFVAAAFAVLAVNKRKHPCGREALYVTAQEALSAYLLTLLEQGRPIAAPSDLSTFHPDDGFPSLVSCDIDQYKETKAVKKTLTIPSWLNDRAVSMGLNFSKVLQDALIAKIQV